MAGKRTIAPAPKSETFIRESTDAARDKLQTRVEMGRALRDAISQIRTGDDFERIKQQFDTWDEYNTELLKRMFTTEEHSTEYGYATLAFAIGGSYSQHEEINDLRVQFDKKLRRLESLMGRLELIPSAAHSVEHGRPSVKRAGIESNKVFVVHGHDDGAKETAARFISKLGLTPEVLHEQPNKGRTIIEKFEGHSEVAFAVVLFTPDDIGYPRNASSESQTRPRQNVVFELGFFLGALGRDRVCVLYWEDVQLPSDIAGVVFIKFDPAGAWRLQLARELKAAGLQVDLNNAI